MADGTPRQGTVVQSAAARSWPNLRNPSRKPLRQALGFLVLASWKSGAGTKAGSYASKVAKELHRLALHLDPTARGTLEGV